ncbi:aminoacyl-histidine dipeptidase [Simiduia sp. 21SJ11W-1]|uniref:aminoacyl-histidine dipeptidase n=1 Tax=Simiduia sp. 21SJ11W-1 TaxID=2909669 RepID=UPI0020A1D7B3|nr:aminoacyl-histidine dipeptidase [Simiduia sp. 21SJ11W-1]UTA49134.1 aminoacyl-histidine dipeptidase [Simiduia sp. 21SJ11W-1]
MTNSHLQQLEPRALWRHFETLCNTPRPSGHEAAIIEKIEAFAAGLGLTVLRDDVGNVVIRKPASKGYEHSPGVILQSHLDMVPQKSQTARHDFTQDPIQTVIQGDWVHAVGTTLGADNGIGVAAILAVLESTNLTHGPLEALFTIDEEAGMTGAKGLSPDILQGRLLFNLDTEDEGELYVGCAGGIDVNARIAGHWGEPDAQSACFQLSVSGLLGGHSGLDINLGRANANLLIAQFIARLSDALPVRIAHIQGGTLRNAIARDGRAVFTVPAALAEAVGAAFDKYLADVQHCYGQLETGMSLTLAPAEPVASALGALQTRALVSALLTCPHGAQRMSPQLAGVVETSNNLATVGIEGDTLVVQCLVRSLIDEARDDLAANIARHFQLIDADTLLDGAYPGWAPNMQSALLEQMRAVYAQKYGKPPAVKVIHAGLECGLLGAIYPNWDMISFGPTIRGAHSPDERVHIASVAAFWECLVAGLAAVATQA